MLESFEDTAESPAVKGYLHEPASPSGIGLVLTHGAGGNCNTPMLVAVAEKFAEAGITVLRCDLPFRQARPKGSPSPSGAAQDRAGLARAVRVLRGRTGGKVYLGGQSYGGRQASMLLAEDTGAAAGLLLLSYPLHPPGKPENLRTAHLPQIRVPILFVHGTKDPFGSTAEMNAATQLLHAPYRMVVVEGAGHDLGGKKACGTVPEKILEGFGWLKAQA